MREGKVCTATLTLLNLLHAVVVFGDTVENDGNDDDVVDDDD